MDGLSPALPLLTADEEVRLARLIEAGVAASAVLAGHRLRVEASRDELAQIVADGERARERFLLSNLRLVAFAVGGTASRIPGGLRDEVFQEGVAALAGTLRAYDWRRGRFSTLALRTVRWKVEEYVASVGGSLGVPAGRAMEIRRARSIAARLESESGGPASVSAVAGEMGRDASSTASLLRYRPPVSIEGMPPELQERTLADAPAGGLAEEVRLDLRRLPRHEREAITLRFGLADGRPRSWLEVAEATGTSVSTAKRVCGHALATLRSPAAEPAPESSDEAVLAQARLTGKTLQEADRLSRAGLSLVEVAIALKVEPVELHDACLAGRRQDLLARFGRLEQSYGFEPSPYTAPYVVETKESARRRARFLAADSAPGEPETRPQARPLHETIAPPKTDPRRHPAGPQPTSWGISR